MCGYRDNDVIRNVNWKIKHGCMFISHDPIEFRLIAELIAICLVIISDGNYFIVLDTELVAVMISAIISVELSNTL